MIRKILILPYFNVATVDEILIFKITKLEAGEISNWKDQIVLICWKRLSPAKKYNKDSLLKLELLLAWTSYTVNKSYICKTRIAIAFCLNKGIKWRINMLCRDKKFSDYNPDSREFSPVYIWQIPVKTFMLIAHS